VADQTSLRPPKALLRPIGRAIVQHQMIQEGDRVLIGLFGGKDSLSLLLVHHFALIADLISL